MKDYFDGQRTYFMQLSGYSIAQLIEKYERDAKKAIAKFNELDKLSGNARNYPLYGFWDRQILPSLLEKMGKYVANEKMERERLNNALFHLYKISPELDRFIKEIRDD